MGQRATSEHLSRSVVLCRRNALHVVTLAWTTHPHLRFDSAGVRWLDRYITQAKSHLSPELAEEFIYMMGSYYGECLVDAFGGAWDLSGDKLGVRTPGLGITFPFEAVRRHINGGADDAVGIAYFAAVDYLAEDWFPATA